MRDRRMAWVLITVMLSAGAVLAQSRGTVTVMANVRPSILFSGTTPAGTNFSQGGDTSASATIPVLAASEPQTFTTRAVAANNPSSMGYDLVAKLTSPGKVVVDGIELSTAETVIAAQAPYGVLQTHTIEVAGATAMNIVVTCRPR